MPCPVCSATMHNLGLAGCGNTYWCHRCGTLLSVKPGAPDNISRPALLAPIRDAHSAMQLVPKFAYTADEAELVPKWFWEAILEAVGLRPAELR